MEYTPEIDERIGKHLSGESTAEEQAWLEQWLMDAAENRRYFGQMQRLWQLAEGAGSILPKLDVERALASTKAKMHQQTVIKAKVVPLSYRWMGVAAALAVLLGAIWFFHSTTSETSVSFAAHDEAQRHTLSDGSSVSLNQQSSITAVFTEKTRRIKMVGEAYFEVAPDPAKPFIVEISGVEIRVVGTQFNVDGRSLSNTVVVSVDEGKVQVSSGQNTEMLGAGEQATMDTQTGRLIRKQMRPSDNVGAWANRRLVFDDIPLSEVLPVLENTYQVSIELGNPALAQCRLQVRFNNEPIERILLLIAETFSLELTSTNGQFLLNGANCGE